MLIKASKKTYQRRLNQLIKEVSNHTYRNELLHLMKQQVLDENDYPYTDGHNSFMDGYCKVNG
jgi:hypothetical protein